MNSERVRQGMAEAAATHRAEGNAVPWGFKAQVDDATAQRILNDRERGVSYGKIAARLDADGVPTPGGGTRWYPSTVSGICKRLGAAA